MAVAKKVSKLMALWTESAKDKEAKELKILLSKSKLSAKKDTAKADERLILAQEDLAECELRLAAVESRLGSEWSPAKILNCKIDIEEAEAKVAALEEVVAGIDAIVKQYIG